MDNDRELEGTEYLNIPIKHTLAYLGNDSKKILISAHYAEIAEQLNALG